ncbi:MAG: DUF1269 domain-containing protein [Gammaproteobacteria bacterium]|nr:DUF1269 domain-containing protein [Gammaproteobacteria bacterium]
MRKRLYYLLSDVPTTRKIVDELLLARIDESRIHVLAKDNNSMEGLPAASLMQSSDIVHGIETGLVIGGLTGLVVSLIATVSLELGSMVGVVILSCTLLGSLLGIWTSSMVGSDLRNSRLKSFEGAIEDGKVLLMVDVPQQRIEDISNKIESHKQAHKEGLEPSIPAFP